MPGGEVNVDAGVFRVVNGASFATGGSDGKLFNINRTNASNYGTLAGGGAVQSPNGFKISGTLSPDSYYDNMNAADGLATREGTAIGTLSLTGNVLLDGATLEIDTAAGNVSGKISVTGNVAFHGSMLNNVDVSAFRKGVYTIMDWAGSQSGGLADFNSVTGFIPNSRQTATLSIDDKKLLLTMAADNKTLTWTGSLSAVWQDGQSTLENWKDGASTPTFFINGDAVVFDSAGTNQAITGTGDVNVADMSVTANGYSFSGGKITGAANTDIAGSTGKLTLSAGSHTTTFENEIDFAGGIAVGAGHTLAFNYGASPVTNNNAISGSGNLKKSGAESLTLGNFTATGGVEVAAGTLKLVKTGAYNFNNALAAGTATSILAFDLGAATNALSFGLRRRQRLRRHGQPGKGNLGH